LIGAVGNFSVNSGQRLEECGKTKLKNKVPRKTAGLLPENGGEKPALSLENQRNIFKKAGREV
jgi:hypothetical protein